MRRTLLIVVTLSLALAVSASSQDLTDQMLVSGYLGYSLGFGDYFEDYETPVVKIENSAGFSFGASFHYWMREKCAIGGEIMFQSYGSDTELKQGAPAGAKGDGGSTDFNLLITGLHALEYTDDASIFLTGGIGLYDAGGMKFGLNAGAIYRKMVTEDIGIYVMPRLHLVFANDMYELVQLAVGIQIPLERE